MPILRISPHRNHLVVNNWGVTRLTTPTEPTEALATLIDSHDLNRNVIPVHHFPQPSSPIALFLTWIHTSSSSDQSFSISRLITLLLIFFKAVVCSYILQSISLILSPPTRTSGLSGWRPDSHHLLAIIVLFIALLTALVSRDFELLSLNLKK